MAWTWLALALLPMTIAGVWISWRLWQNRRRFRAIRTFLDAADLLEHELQECKARMQAMQNWVAQLPNAGSREASDRLDPSNSVQKSLKQLLGQRLWLKDSAEKAPVVDIEAASANLERARVALASHMEKLDAMSGELKRASTVQEQALARHVEANGASHTLH